MERPGDNSPSNECVQHVLNLPNEILVRIAVEVKCSNVQPDDSSNEKLPPGAHEIMNFRLVCQLFCKISSHLLLEGITVDLHPSSLSRLVAFSHHPTIRTGIEEVRVNLLYYDPILASDFREFLSFHLARFNSLIVEVEPRDIQYLHPKDKLFGIMLASCTAWLAGSTDSLDLDSIRPLQLAHTEYRKRFLQQEDLVKDNNFVHGVAAAFARMPRARTLCIQSTLFVKKPSKMCTPLITWEQEMDNNGMFDIATTLLPMSWKVQQRRHPGERTSKMLYSLPGAIHTAGGSQLRELRIEIAPLKGMSTFMPEREDIANLGGIANGLISFKLESYEIDCRDTWSFHAELEFLKAYLSTVLNSKSLKVLDLRLDYLWNADGMEIPRPQYSLGDIVAVPSWSSLSSLTLLFLPFHLGELQQLGDNIPNELNNFVLAFSKLLSGTWEEAADMLREKTFQEIIIESSGGGETMEMSAQERKALFEVDPPPVVSGGLDGGTPILIDAIEDDLMEANSAVSGGETESQQDVNNSTDVVHSSHTNELQAQMASTVAPEAGNNLNGGNVPEVGKVGKPQTIVEKYILRETDSNPIAAFMAKKRRAAWNSTLAS